MRRAWLPLLFAAPVSGKTFASHDGTMLAYDVIGKGTPIVMLTGGPGFSSDYFRPVAERLKSRRLAFVLFDQRGTGRSTMSIVDAKTHAFANLVADLEALRKELGQEKLILVGHSWGGILSMVYAAEHPDRVRALALIDAGGPTLASAPKFTANVNGRLTAEDAAKIKEWSAPEKMNGDRRRAVFEVTKAKTAAYFHDRANACLLTASLTADSFSEAVFWAIIPQVTTAFDLRPRLKNLTAPVLIIHGRSDPLETAQEVHEALAGSRLEMIEGAGHFPWLEQPQKVLGLLEEFLRGR